MLKTKSHFKLTRKGNVVKVVRELYIRDDIVCGISGCNLCRVTESFKTPSLTPSKNGILILDTNVVLHQIDLLENPVLSDIIILQTVLEEVKHQSASIYKRIREVIANESRSFYVFNNELCSQTQVDRPASETANDRNDRAIRVATKWYQNHLASKSTPVMLLTNDKANMEKALAEGLKSKTIHEYVHSISDLYPVLVDILVDPSMDHTDEEDKKLSVGFSEHKSIATINASIKDGKLHQGVLRMQRGAIEAHVASEKLGEDILIQGWDSINRAIDMGILDHAPSLELIP